MPAGRAVDLNLFAFEITLDNTEIPSVKKNEPAIDRSPSTLQRAKKA